MNRMVKQSNTKEIEKLSRDELGLSQSVHFVIPSLQRSALRRGCLLSYSQAEPGRKLTQPSPRLLAEPCTSRRTYEYVALWGAAIHVKDF